MPVVDDDVKQEQEQFSPSLTSFSNASAGSRIRATGTIVDDDKAGALTAKSEKVSAEHDRNTAFSFYAAFTKDVGTGYASMRDETFTVNGPQMTPQRALETANRRRTRALAR